MDAEGTENLARRLVHFCQAKARCDLIMHNADPLVGKAMMITFTGQSQQQEGKLPRACGSDPASSSGTFSACSSG